MSKEIKKILGVPQERRSDQSFFFYTNDLAEAVKNSICKLCAKNVKL